MFFQSQRKAHTALTREVTRGHLSDLMGARPTRARTCGRAGVPRAAGPWRWRRRRPGVQLQVLNPPPGQSSSSVTFWATSRKPALATEPAPLGWPHERFQSCASASRTRCSPQTTFPNARVSGYLRGTPWRRPTDRLRVAEGAGALKFPPSFRCLVHTRQCQLGSRPPHPRAPSPAFWGQWPTDPVRPVRAHSPGPAGRPGAQVPPRRHPAAPRPGRRGVPGKSVHSGRVCCFLLFLSDKDTDRGAQLPTPGAGNPERAAGGAGRSGGTRRPARGGSGRRLRPRDPAPRPCDPGASRRPGRPPPPRPRDSRPVRPPESRPAPPFPGNASLQRRRRAGDRRKRGRGRPPAGPLAAGRTDRSCRPPPWCRCRCRCRRRAPRPARCSPLASCRVRPRSPLPGSQPRPRPAPPAGRPARRRPHPRHAATSRPAPAHARQGPAPSPRPRPAAPPARALPSPPRTPARGSLLAGACARARAQAPPPGPKPRPPARSEAHSPARGRLLARACASAPA